MAWRLVKPGLRILNRMTVRTEPLSAGQLWRMWRGMWRGLGTYEQARAIADQRLTMTSLEAGEPT